MKSELRRLLEDEFQAIGAEMPAWERDVNDFWLHPDEPDLAIWANPWWPRDVPEPPDGSISERELYDQLMRRVKPAIAYRELGFQNVPTLRAHGKLYTGPNPGPHFTGAVMGGKVIRPDRLPAGGIPPEAYAHIEPVISDVDKVEQMLPVVEDIDIRKSPLHQCVVRALEEMKEVVLDAVPFLHYAPTSWWLDVLSVTDFFMLTALDPELTRRFLDVCQCKWLELLQVQEAAVGGRWCNQHYEPGIIMGAWDDELSPTVHRNVMLPFFANASEHYTGLTFHLGHPDTSLLKDYLALPHVRACQISRDWPAELLCEKLPGKVVLQFNCNEHLHAGQEAWNRVQRTWEFCLEKFAGFAGKLRAQILLGHYADTPEDHRAGMLKEGEELRRIWDNARRQSPA